MHFCRNQFLRLAKSGKFSGIKGIGGGVNFSFNHFSFDICCSPTFLVSKMGSLVS